PGAYVDCGDLPLFAARDGVRIEAWVYPGDFEVLRSPPDDGGDRTPRPAPPGAKRDDLYLFEVVGKGEAYFLRVREDYAVVAGVKGAASRAPTVRETAPGALRPERWAELSFSFDGEDMKILVNGLRRDLPPAKDAPDAALPKAIAPDAAPLTVSNPAPGLCFFGAIDEVRVSGVNAEESVEFGSDLAIDAPAAVRFDARGELDGLYHPGPVRIEVRRVGTGTGPRGSTLSAQAITVERSGALR
ncbi:MAG TPA: hypothetical protein VHF22_11570, partial [Planctomycetota bacterium]|nr:hypothetical protein [Planctomycetota bacterium]